MTKKIKLGSYINLNESIKALVDYTIQQSIKENSILRVGFKKRKPKAESFWFLSWSDINLLRHYINQKDIKSALALVYSVTDKEFLKLDLFNCSACYKFIVKQIEAIGKTEERELGYKPSPKEIASGIKELEQYGYSVALHQLSGGDINKEDEILEYSYQKIFKKRCLMRTLNDIERNRN